MRPAQVQGLARILIMTGSLRYSSNYGNVVCMRIRDYFRKNLSEAEVLSKSDRYNQPADRGIRRALAVTEASFTAVAKK
jgi:hypothetical protein